MPTFAHQLKGIGAQMAESVDALVSNTSRFTPVPVRPRLWVLKERNESFSLFCFAGVGEGLRPTAVVISLLCVQARRMQITLAFACGNLANPCQTQSCGTHLKKRLRGLHRVYCSTFRSAL